MILAELHNNDEIHLSAGEGGIFREKDRIKLVPSSRWDTQRQIWWMPVSWAACIQLRAVFGEELIVGPELNTWAANEIQTRINPCLAWRQAEDADLPMFGALYPFQRAGVAFMATAGNALNADEMGLGKSVQAIGTLELIGESAYPALIVCPNSMKFSWKAEYKDGKLVGGWDKWAPGRNAVVITGTPAKRKKAIEAVASGEAQVGIINYEALRSHTRLAKYGTHALTDSEKQEKELNAIEFGTIIADEAHRVKDPNAKQTRALWWIGDRAPYRFALTGTPIANSPEDIWTLMRFVSPREYPKKTAFIDRYALQTYNVFGFTMVAGIKSEHSEELFRILDPRFIRRLKKVVLPQLPEKVYTTRVVRMETESGTKTKQGQAYESMRKEMMTKLEGGTLLATNPMTQALRLSQFASAHGEMVDRGNVDKDGNPVLDLVLTEPSCKVDALMDILYEVGDEQVVVFSESRQLIEIAHARLIKEGGKKNGPFFGLRVGIVTGMVPEHERAEYVRQFQNRELKVLLLTLAAGGEGLTLTAASTAIFLQRSWNSVLNMQAEDRIHRIGQDANRVTIIDVLTENTIEDRVREVLATKAEMMEEVCRDEATWKGWLAK